MVCLLELQLAIKSEDVSSVWKVPALIEFSWTHLFSHYLPTRQQIGTSHNADRKVRWEKNWPPNLTMSWLRMVPL